MLFGFFTIMRAFARADLVQRCLCLVSETSVIFCKRDTQEAVWEHQSQGGKAVFGGRIQCVVRVVDIIVFAMTLYCDF